ncbi:ATP phosphoribosyltransferase regulatory subunit [Plesiocystis pacifica SIR-1]|uniref:ATP phosphoribosyltransferase regulatory subunit n=1 Tax=Plesiocystis pacifica SIR-1 TaxID=391625 RepID=A6G000_9BACT|nr:ATP phosphoribosyltransferase regulatory subunit [Plesiocystis pacifica]EDM80697.1 ATP phosphoribosyltransferase regulatory subunit [Plesiocystis pacifica SIR-1]
MTRDELNDYDWDSAVVDTSVFNPLPIGARDLLPTTSRRRRSNRERLLRVFEGWGYREITPPLLEYFEVHARGLSADMAERCVRFIEAGTGDVVALRSDVTPQIARVIAQRVGGEVEAGDQVRLCYAATSVRLPHGRHDRSELHQVGVECVGEQTPWADAELIGLADEALSALGSTAHRFDLSHTGVGRKLIAGLDLPKAVAKELRARLGRKDRGGVVDLLGSRCAPAQVDAVAELCELYGPPAILDRARELLAGVDAGEARAALEELRAVVEVVQRQTPAVAERLLVDLGEVRGFDYYTGLRMRVWAPGASEPVVRGGRYDDMLTRYGATLPASGLAIDLDALDEALMAADSGQADAAAPATMLAVQPGEPSGAGQRRARAAELAASLRRDGQRAWICAVAEVESALRQASRRGAQGLVWFASDGSVQRWREGAEGWSQQPS